MATRRREAWLLFTTETHKGKLPRMGKEQKLETGLNTVQRHKRGQDD